MYMVSDKNSHIYITSAIYTCVTCTSIILTVLSIFILNVINPNVISYKLLDYFQFFWSCVFVYFYFQYIILPTIIFLFFIEIILTKKFILRTQTYNQNGIFKIQHYFFLVTAMFSVLINISLIHIT